MKRNFPHTFFILIHTSTSFSSHFHPDSHIKDKKLVQFKYERKFPGRTHSLHTMLSKSLLKQDKQDTAFSPLPWVSKYVIVRVLIGTLLLLIRTF